MKITITQAELATVLKDYYSLESTPEVEVEVEVEVVSATEVAPKSKRGITRYNNEVICQPSMELDQDTQVVEGSRRALSDLGDTKWSLHGGAANAHYGLCTEAEAIAWVEDGVLPQK